MNRKEAIKRLNKIIDYYYIEMLKNGHDDEIDNIMEVLESPLALADLLGWEEGMEYEYYPAQNDEVTERAKIVDNIFYVFSSSADDFVRSPIYTEDIPNMTQAKRVEKQIAYHVKDEYSYNCLIMELEERAHAKAPHFNGYDSCIPIIYINSDGKYSGAMLDSIIARSHIIVEYHKEEPKFYAKIKGWELIKDDDCYWHNDKNPIHGLYPWSREEASIYTKTEWNKLGINDTNADFEEVKE